MTLLVGTPLNFLLTTHAPERLTLKALTEIGMRCAPHEIHGRATDRAHQPVICTEAKAFFYTHARSSYCCGSNFIQAGLASFRHRHMTSIQTCAGHSLFCPSAR